MQSFLRNSIFSSLWRWLAVATLLSLAGCTGVALPTGTPTATEQGSQGEIIIAAAADLQFAFQDIAEIYEQETGQQVRLVFGSTGLDPADRARRALRLDCGCKSGIR
jgi:ABC-type molybdate transport system substrate-binding protein